MALSSLQHFVVKYRNRSTDDLNQCLISLCRLLSSFSTIDKQTEPVVVALRELYLVLQLSRSERRVPENVTSLFLSALQDLKVIHPQLMTMLVACLAEMSPSTSVRIDIKALESVDVGRIPVFLRLLRQQDLPMEFGYYNCVQLVKFLNDTVAGVSSKKAVLAFFASQFRIANAAVMYQDCFDVVCWSLANWLVNASVFDDSQQEKLRRTTKSTALLSVTELDGSTPAETFTVLCLARSYGEDQQMNMLSFSLLYDMLLAAPHRESMTFAEENGSLSMPLATLQGRVRAANIEDLSFDHCLLVLKQAEVRPLKSSYDCELQDAVLSEAVRIIDFICMKNPKLVRRAFRTVADVNDRAMRRIHNIQVLLHTYQFMLNHGETANFELDNMSHFLCCDLLPSSGMTDNVFASEFLALLRRNKQIVGSRSKVFSRYFPSLFKVLAWNPRANMHLFVDLMAPIVTPVSYLEVFHLLVDLPCVSAALEVSVFGEGSYLNAVRQLSADRAKDQRLKFFFDFFLRNEGGRGELVDNVSAFHRALTDVAVHPRIGFCSSAVSALLSIYFSTVASLKSEISRKKLALAILDRMHTLYCSYADVAQLQTVMADGMCMLLSGDSSMFAEIYISIADYIVANHFLFTTFLTSLVWCIGDHVNEAFGEKFPHVVVKLYDSVESLTYDIIKTQSSSLVHDSMELFRTSLTTMTKMGSLSEQLTRRTVICLNNVIKKTREHPEQQRFHIVDQIYSLIKMLALPSVSDIVMNLSISPEPEVLEAIKHVKSAEDERNELSSSGHSL